MSIQKIVSSLHQEANVDSELVSIIANQILNSKKRKTNINNSCMNIFKDFITEIDAGNLIPEEFFTNPISRTEIIPGVCVYKGAGTSPKYIAVSIVEMFANDLVVGLVEYQRIRS